MTAALAFADRNAAPAAVYQNTPAYAHNYEELVLLTHKTV